MGKLLYFYPAKRAQVAGSALENILTKLYSLTTLTADPDYLLYAVVAVP